jgi:hypothetical protein
VVTFILAGLLTIDTLWGALLPAVLYLGIHLVEGETITPMLLARRFTLNPVLVILSFCAAICGEHVRPSLTAKLLLSAARTISCDVPKRSAVLKVRQRNTNRAYKSKLSYVSCACRRCDRFFLWRKVAAVSKVQEIDPKILPALSMLIDSASVCLRALQTAPLCKNQSVGRHRRAVSWL